MEIELFSAGLRLAIPILIAALGELVVQRSGIINISVEGMMLLGAFFSFWICFYTGSPLIGLFAGVFAGMLAAILFAGLSVFLPCDQIIVATGINLLALGLTGSLFRMFFGTQTSIEIVPAQELFFEWIFWMLPVLVFLFLIRTFPGLALRMTGEIPKAVESMGKSVLKIRFCALLFGGLTAGLAGAYLSIVHSSTFVENMTAGRGFIALAIVIFGRWQPLGVLFAALFFGVALSFQYQIQALDIHLPYQVVRMLPFGLTLLILAVMGQKKGGAPSALGVPYQKN